MGNSRVPIRSLSDEKFIVTKSVSNDMLQIWEGRTGSLLRSHGGAGMYAVAVNPTGTRFAVRKRESLEIYESMRGVPLLTIREGAQPLTMPLQIFQWTSDGARIVEMFATGGVHVWESRGAYDVDARHLARRLLKVDALVQLERLDVRSTWARPEHLSRVGATRHDAST